MDKASARPLRSVLFVPGDQVDLVDQALRSGADSIVIDLEEPRTPYPETARHAGREGIRAYLDRVVPGPDQPVVFARVQPPSSGQTLKDLRAVMGEVVSGVLVPKVHGPEDIHAMHALLHGTEVDLGLPVGS